MGYEPQTLEYLYSRNFENIRNTKRPNIKKGFDIFFFDCPAKPLIVTETGRVAGNISQVINSSSTETIVTRV